MSTPGQRVNIVARPYPSQRVVRPLIVITALLGLNYLIWRWLFSVHWSVWWISVPLVIAETYSLIDSLLFGVTMWRLKRRPTPGLPPDGATADVFVTTYNEPIDLIMVTARAAKAIRYPHTTWILDDGNRAELRERAEAEGIGFISRSSDWIDRPRHAKAGNLNNALMITHGEFIVILDADQVPYPALLDDTLGYFRDEQMGIVQTPQFFVNVPESDPLGSQAPLFYGPIQQGKDGWNAAFFCGSNAVLRREALLQVGVRRYVHELESRIDSALSAAGKVIRKARAGLGPGQELTDQALASVLDAARDARAELKQGAAIADATARFQTRVRLAARNLVEADVVSSQADLVELAALASQEIDDALLEVESTTLDRLARRDWSPLGAIEAVRVLIASVDVDREDEAQPIMAMSTISVTEDMATCMRLHGMGWKSAYHDETLAVGLAPEDVGTMLTQRLRWAQGTVQVMMRENPFTQRGLSFVQRLMYTATMWSYLSGFAALAYIAAPVIYLIFGVLPVNALSSSFFLRLIPFLLFNQLLFFVIGRGRHTWRGQQYALALFPIWIKAVTSAVGNVAFGRSLAFAVTPKTKVHIDRPPWHLVRPQLFAMGLLLFAAAIGTIRFAAGQATGLGTSINIVWVAFDLALFSIIPRAVLYKGFETGAEPEPEPTPVPAAVAESKQEIS
jgi:cellulose synthase (UDP-forming)